MKMRRYRIFIMLILFSLTLIEVSAEDFWIKKDWKQWSSDDCWKMLNESPWSRRWTGGVPGSGSGAIETFTVEIFSAQPVREAIVRQQQISQHYEKMNDEQKKGFDLSAEQVMSHNFDDAIVFRVDYSATPDVSPTFVQEIREDASNCEDCFLIAEKGEQIRPFRFVSHLAAKKFDLSFPRVLNGERVIKEAAKIFHVQFQRLTTTDRVGLVKVPFFPDAMKWNGKVTY